MLSSSEKNQSVNTFKVCLSFLCADTLWYLFRNQTKLNSLAEK